MTAIQRLWVGALCILVAYILFSPMLIPWLGFVRWAVIDGAVALVCFGSIALLRRVYKLKT
jgi:predicted membrane-bound spermidine synthase